LTESLFLLLYVEKNPNQSKRIFERTQINCAGELEGASGPPQMKSQLNLFAF
jgi:hypothetical protein